MRSASGRGGSGLHSKTASARVVRTVEKDVGVDRHLTRYVLGLLPDEEAERLDEQSIMDDEVAARLRSVENDLVDAYVCGTLEGELLEPFEPLDLGAAH